jgi:RNA polymerase sigma-19 factor, ECF subfamily
MRNPLLRPPTGALCCCRGDEWPKSGSLPLDRLPDFPPTDALRHWGIRGRDSVTDLKAKPGQTIAELTTAVVGRYGRELHRYLVRRLRRPADADDLAQEVYLRLLRRNRSEAVVNPRAYVYRIASHVVSEFRARSEQGAGYVTFDSEIVEQLERQPLGQPTEDELAERLDLQRQVQLALAVLPPTHQAVFILHKRDGLTHQEIAQRLQLSMHTIEKYLVQAKARLRTIKWDR